MDLLEEYNEKYVLSKSRILSEVDEWTLYYFYLGIEDLTTRTTYNSPIRDDDSNPSFSIYENTRSKKEVEYLWKDSALSVSGDIFILIQKMFNLSEMEVLQKISYDFAILDDSSDIEIKRIERPTSKSSCRIRYKSKKFSKEGLAFWKSFNVSIETLEWKQVKEVEFLWFSEDQECPYKCNSLTFCYPEYSKELRQWFTQVYCPFESKQFKFRNDIFLEDLVYGWNHLKFESDLHIITKSNKDILVLKELGYESTSPKSETTPYPKSKLEILKSSYKRVASLYDNDLAGIENSKKLDIENLFIPLNSNCKDISDYSKAFGLTKTNLLLLNILGT